MTPTPINEHPLANEVREKLTDGTVTVGCPIEPHEWTADDHERLAAACAFVERLRREEPDFPKPDA
ncbi:MAG: hypothetical protein GY833_12620 [Aestuariibacter sp.]|nr:hypothetical protein [Aestuariibacter sp.]